jgi:DNA-binding response OmpR family regulator
MKLLVIDKDRVTVEMLTSWLSIYGYKMHHAFTSSQAKREWLGEKPDLVILDTALENEDALKMCRELRSRHDALVLVLSSEKDIDDEVRCLQAGVDEYVRKPFYPAQLLARIQALSQRIRFAPKQQPTSTITLGPLKMDFLHNQVMIHGRTEALTPTESRLLYFLAVHANTTCFTTDIIENVWGHRYAFEGDSELLKPHIRHLREKIESDPSKPKYIFTRPGEGYSLILPVSLA